MNVCKVINCVNVLEYLILLIFLLDPQHFYNKDVE